MTEMRHDRDVSSTHFFHVSEQFDERIGVRVRREALRPEGQSSSTDAQILDMWQVVRVLEGLQVLLEPALCDRDDGAATALSRNGSEAKIKPLTSSCDGHESIQGSEGAATPQNAASAHVRLHDHGVAAREEDVRDLLVLLQIVEETVRVLLRKTQIRVADKLGPSKAVRAVGVARLGGRGEEEDRLRVLVLHAREFGLLRRVQGLLAGGVGI